MSNLVADPNSLSVSELLSMWTMLAHADPNTMEAFIAKIVLNAAPEPVRLWLK